MRVAKINFNPSTKEEKFHLKKMKKLLSRKRRGDWDLVAGELKVSNSSALKSFMRVYSNNHFEAVEALANVIENRKNLLIK